MKEGFVKVLKKNNLNDVKRYFFYLTYNDRADIESVFNRPEINEMSEVNDLTAKKKLNNQNTLDLRTPYSSYYTYRNELRKEWKSDRIKQLEVIMSYSKSINEFMFHMIGQEAWESKYREIVLGIMKKHFKKNRHILCYFHKLDSTGYRYHSHVLLYPYQNNRNGFPLVYSHIEPEKLQLIKEEFQREISDFAKSKRDLIRNRLQRIAKARLKEGQTVNENSLFSMFLERNLEIKNLFT